MKDQTCSRRVARIWAGVSGLVLATAITVPEVWAAEAIKVVRTVHLAQPDLLEEAVVGWAGYVAPDRNVLMEAITFGGQRGYYFTAHRQSARDHHPREPLIRWSGDNGRTWENRGTWTAESPIQGNWKLNIEAPNFVFNPGNGTLLRLYRTTEAVSGLLPWVKGAPAGRTGLLWTQYSRDGGRTWSEAEQLICHGPEFDPTHWAPGIWYGRNSGGVQGVDAVWLPDGRFLLPFFSTDETQLHKYQSACLIGRWRAEDDRVEWSLTASATVPEAASYSGGDEPSVAVLADGRWLMTMRAYTPANLPLAIPSGKFHVTSADEGRTWSEPAILRLTDGRQAYGPASLTHVFRSSRNGRLYLITNILDRPTVACDPRSTLQIAELDPQSLRVKPETMTVIETRDVAAGQPENIRFSNWRRYEDRENGHIVLLMTACPGDVGRHETCGVPPHSYRYEITLPE